MNIILVSDVFGVTSALLSTSEKLGACLIVDPYNGQKMAFQNEADAYSYFVENIGLDNYLSHLIAATENIDHQTILIGFSVGASAIWRLSEQKSHQFINQAFCFYGSQIRNFMQIEPKFKINLVFPKSEPHFDVAALQKNLTKKANVKTKSVEYFHGFMNYHSTNFNSVGYAEQIDFLCSVNT